VKKCEKVWWNDAVSLPELNVSGMEKGDANREQKGASGSKIKMGWAKMGWLRPSLPERNVLDFGRSARDE
jgi:hypothetical protein